MRIRLAASILLVACGGSATAQSLLVLADGRAEGSGADLSDWAMRPPIEQAAAAARAYWRAQDPSYEEDMGVFGVAEGAFTASGARQQAVLYLMSAWPRCCPKMGLALVEDDRLVRNVAFAHSALSLTAVPDLDGDGRDELVTTGWFGTGGQESGSMTLLSFGDGGVEEWGTTAIYDGACAAGHDGTTAARVTAEVGPVFTIERFAQPSCTDPTWQPDGGPEPFTFEPPGESDYVVLSAAGGGTGGVPAGGGTRSERGELRAGDTALTSGEFYDTYEVEGRAGDRLVVDLRSSDFDPYLILVLPDDEQIENDDFEGDRTHSQIATTLPVAGTYHVLVTSYVPGESGAYDLTIHVGE